MDLDNLITIITPVIIILGTIIWVEIVRDCYHALSHYWQPLYRLHSWHHKVFRPDLTAVSEDIYRKAHWYNDLPEALVMLTLSFIPGLIFSWQTIPYSWVAWTGSLYTLTFLFGAIARGAGVPYVDELTDLTHRPGDFTTLPAPWFVNRPYHWRHHFDNQKAYYSGTLTLVDKIMGTALSLKGKTIGVTGASGTLGLSLLKELHLNGAKVIALTSQDKQINLEIEAQEIPIKTLTWQVGKETDLIDELTKIDILIINHGLNVHQERSEKAIIKSYEVNTFSGWRLMECFLKTVKTNQDKVRKEVWVNTSEAEVNPALSPLYELSKRTFGDLITLRRLDAPCVVRKLILGPFKSNLNPIGVMSADWVAKQIIKGAKSDNRNIIVTINPITFIVFPVKEMMQTIYFKLFTKARDKF
ncbi:bifunctional sterol desaturase/short chain dehydrogenase [Crocosphaera sp. UHCC 0190]|uniref:bifunctional sterol desaturase/short chain dehydrogenase n=1 Tax=Crocosphaera sp. UHCC 0190 TaxID=3110246 RepID=UPI002B1F255C|nr:bifunctional sterol desaturase/short chain dehydrogenase [Crocosphaera sp. UHCC 0190]MEA5510103.1 bifunctional sterol desaturase/short chain dehydrogenase [Crocosphaera sp. UHCC 0190]